MTTELLTLALAWIAWCALHSLLIHPPVEAWLAGQLGPLRRGMRLFYNLLAVTTLVPVIFFTHSVAGMPVWVWPDWTAPLLWLARLGGLWLLIAGARRYGLGRFSGWAGLAAEGGFEGSAPPELVRCGILNRTRHPWYLAALLLLWSRDLASTDLLVNVILSCYLVIGSELEERKLLVLHGESYRRYRQAVPRFWPRWRLPP